MVRDGKLVTVDEAALAAEAAEIAPGFRKEVEAQIKRTADLIAPLLEGNRAAWKVQLGVERYVGGPKELLIRQTFLFAGNREKSC